MIPSSKLAEYRAAEAAATVAPWTAEVDLFGDGEWEAAVSNAETALLFTAGTGVPMYEGDDRYPWTAEDSRKRDERCAQAKQSQAMHDARFIALARSAVPELLAENEALRAALREACELAEDLRNAVDRADAWDATERPNLNYKTRIAELQKLAGSP